MVVPGQDRTLNKAMVVPHKVAGCECWGSGTVLSSWLSGFCDALSQRSKWIERLRHPPLLDFPRLPNGGIRTLGLLGVPGSTTGIQVPLFQLDDVQLPRAVSSCSALPLTAVGAPGSGNHLRMLHAVGPPPNY